MTRALLIVDVQNDFTEGGALGVSGGAAVAEGIREFLAGNADAYALIAASRDWHDADNSNGGHFAEVPDYVDTWPVHCVAHTPGAEYHSALPVQHITEHIYKGQGRPDYSAFQGQSAANAALADVLQAAQITEIDVVGIATDHCVLASARDAREAGFAVRVFTDLVAGVAPAPSVAALEELQACGVEVLPSAHAA